MDDRTALLSVGLVAAVVVVAGCLGAVPGDEARDGEVATVATPAQCDGGETSPGFDLPDAGLPRQSGGFALDASATSVERGDRVTFWLRNVADGERHTGTSARYALQRRDSDGWETVTLFRDPRPGFNATAVVHDPGDGFEWSFRASAGGFTAGKYVVCERLRPGEYRFVFVPSLADSLEIAVRFELVGES